MTRKELIANVISEFAPITTFVAVSETKGFMLGLKALVVVSLISLFLSWKVEKRIPKFGLLAASTIFLFGIISIITHNPFYIIVKDTIYAGVFGLILLIGLLYKKYYLKMLFGDFFTMTEKGWHILTVRWTIFFFILAGTNEITRHILSPNGWVICKLVTVFVTWLFASYQFTLAKRERLPEASPWGLRIKS